MKQHNELVRFKNAFATKPQQKEQLSSILSQDMTTVVADKLQHVIQIYRTQTLQRDYDPALAFRVLTLCLLTNAKSKINLFEELTRMFKYSIESKQLQNIQLCFDILLLKETKDALAQQQLRLLKVRLLCGLRQYYQMSKNKQSFKKCRFTLQEYCKASLQRDRVKHNLQIYNEIMDSLIKEVKLKISRLVKHKNLISAVEQMMSFVGVLQHSEQIVSSKYQYQLMSAYWTLAHLHHLLHYLAYTRKYATIALNIAQRLESNQATKQLRELLQKLI